MAISKRKIIWNLCSYSRPIGYRRHCLPSSNHGQWLACKKTMAGIWEPHNPKVQSRRPLELGILTWPLFGWCNWQRNRFAGHRFCPYHETHGHWPSHLVCKQHKTRFCCCWQAKYQGLCQMTVRYIPWSLNGNQSHRLFFCINGEVKTPGPSEWTNEWLHWSIPPYCKFAQNCPTAHPCASRRVQPATHGSFGTQAALWTMPALLLGV